MRAIVTATEKLETEDVQRLERHGFKPVVRWEKLVEGGGGMGTSHVFTSADALANVRIHEQRSARRRVIVR
jgi:hypothetical protein